MLGLTQKREPGNGKKGSGKEGSIPFFGICIHRDWVLELGVIGNFAAVAVPLKFLAGAKAGEVRFTPRSLNLFFQCSSLARERISGQFYARSRFAEARLVPFIEPSHPMKFA